MSVTHTREKGDSMPKIAAEYGFSDYRTIWQLPENARLRAHRPNPNVERMYERDRDCEVSFPEIDGSEWSGS